MEHNVGLPSGTAEMIEDGLRAIGYRPNMLHRNYRFTDLFEPGTPFRTAPLVAFGEEPPSYRSACVGVVSSFGSSGSRRITHYRSLGTPLIFEVGEERVRAFKVHPEGTPDLWRDVELRHLSRLMANESDLLAPEAMLRAKGIRGGPLERKLDFFDVGLLPAVEKVIRDKLDGVIREAFMEVENEFEEFGHRLDFPFASRVILYLLAGKVFLDRGHRSIRTRDPHAILTEVAKFYAVEPVIYPDSNIQDRIVRRVWNVLSASISFRHLAVDDLAFIYENTLVTRQARDRLAIHSTPLELAEYIVRQLPFENLKAEERTVLEPFSGHGVFLLAALRRLRELLPPDMEPEARHDYLVKHLRGIEIDPFAREVARLCLTITDFPSPDGWKLRPADVFKDDLFVGDLQWSRVVLFNPPFSNFTADERKTLGNRIQSLHKPAEALRRVLQHPPEMLGVVLPESFVHRKSYRDTHERLAYIYREVELLHLPEIFAYSDIPSVALLAWNKTRGATTQVVTRRVPSVKPEKLLARGHVPKDEQYTLTVQPGVSLWRPRLQRVWEALADHNILGKEAEVRRGVEWSISVRGEERAQVIRTEPTAGFLPGMLRVSTSLQPFRAKDDVYVNLDPKFARTGAHTHPWDRPKVVVNSHRKSRGPWRLVAAPDEQGLIPYKTFTAIWPRQDSGLSPLVLSAILNGPVANAFLFTRETGRDNQIRHLKALPLPDINKVDVVTLEGLVHKWHLLMATLETSPMEKAGVVDDVAMRHCLLSIDALILKGYDLPPRFERKLLDLFQGAQRPVPVRFDGYYPPDFQPCIPLYEYISPDFDRSKASSIMTQIEPFADVHVHEMVRGFFADDDG